MGQSFSFTQIKTNKNKYIKRIKHIVKAFRNSYKIKENRKIVKYIKTNCIIDINETEK